MSTSSEQQPTVAEIEERCKAILVNLDSGKSPEASEIKFLVSTDIVSSNMRSPGDGPIGKFAAKMMENINIKQCIGSAEKCNIQPGETVLEIGTGGHGHAMGVLLKTKGLQQLVGIEMAAVAPPLRRARARRRAGVPPHRKLGRSAGERGAAGRSGLELAASAGTGRGAGAGRRRASSRGPSSLAYM